MKKIIPAIIIVLLLFGIIDYKYTRSKYKNISYAVEHHLTSGIYNKYNLRTIETLQVAYTDGKIAIVTITGTEKKVPRKLVKYQVLAERTSGDIWKIKKVYNAP